MNNNVRGGQSSCTGTTEQQFEEGWGGMVVVVYTVYILISAVHLLALLSSVFLPQLLHNISVLPAMSILNVAV